MDQKPSIGRIVHYVLPADLQAASHGNPECAAVVTRVWSDTCVNLQLLPDHDQRAGLTAEPQGLHPTSVCLDESADKQGRTWHWPERV